MSYTLPDYECDGEPITVDTIREYLAKQRIVRFDRDNDIVEVSERCDAYFSVILHSKEIRALGHELIALADEMDA